MREVVQKFPFLAMVSPRCCDRPVLGAAWTERCLCCALSLRCVVIVGPTVVTGLDARMIAAADSRC